MSTTGRTKPGQHIDRTVSLAKAMRARTSSLHRRAEATGFVRDLLHSNTDRDTYGLYLRNLLHVYRTLEEALHAHRHEPPVRHIAWPVLYRQSSIEHDLVTLFGSKSVTLIPLLPAAQLYARRIAYLDRELPALLVAHAYTRYLGDLNGGRILKRMLHERIGIDYAALTFFDYAGVADPTSMAIRYREAIDLAGDHGIDHEAASHEAAVAFRLNIYLSTAVARARSQG